MAAGVNEATKEPKIYAQSNVQVVLGCYIIAPWFTLFQFGENVRGGSDIISRLRNETDLNTTVAMLECS